MTLAEKFKKLFRTSLLLSLLMRLVNSLYDCLRDGLFGRIFTAYSAEEKLFRKGKIGTLFSKRGKAATWIRKVRLRLAEFFEKSWIIHSVTRIARYLLGCSFRFHSIAMLFFGVYTVMICWVKRYAFSNTEMNAESMVIGCLAIVFSFLMMGSRSSVAQLIQKGLIPHSLLIDILGIPEERLDIPRVKGGGKYLYAILTGSILGAVTVLIPVPYVLWALLCILAVAIVMSYPEIGVLALIAFLPFFNLVENFFPLLDFSIVLIALAYLGKMIRGKRIIRFTLMDTMIVFFCLLLWFSGIVSAGGDISLRQAKHACLLTLTYFMIVNLIRTPAWLRRAAFALVGSAVLVALMGVAQYLGGIPDIGRTHHTLSSLMTLRASSIFESSDVLAAYLMILMPLFFAFYVTVSGGKSRMVATGCGLFLSFALFFSWSRSAWLGTVVALLLFFLIYSRKTFCCLLIGGLTVPVWYGFLPTAFLKYLFDMANVSDPSIYRHLYTWRGSMSMLLDYLFGGIGYGNEAFREVYPLYSFSGLESAENTGSLYLSLIAAAGIFGFLIFVITMVVFAQHSFEYIGNASEAYSRTFVAAGFSGITGALVMGIGNDIWQNETVFLTFFVVLALTCAYIRVGTLIRARNQDVSGMDVSHAHVDIHFEA